MATLTNPLGLSGSAGGFTFYKRKDLDKVIMRSRGGASAQKIKTDPGMAGTRRVNNEFGGRATASKYILQGLGALRKLADYNLAPALNGLLCPVQLLDTESAAGQRAVALSRAPWLLEGFQLNKRYPLEQVVTTPLDWLINPAPRLGLATVNFPPLVNGSNFLPPAQYEWFRLIVATAILPDLVHKENGYKPAVPGRYPATQYAFSDWMLVAGNKAARTIEVPVAGTAANTSGSSVLMLTAAIAFGKQVNGAPEQSAYAGAGKILAARLV